MLVSASRPFIVFPTNTAALHLAQGLVGDGSVAAGGELSGGGGGGGGGGASRGGKVEI